MDNKNIGNRIKSIRKNLGFTTEKFATLFDPPASKGTVSKWENGHYLPNNERLKKIAEIGEMTVEDLLHGDRNEVISRAIDDSLKEFIDFMDNEYIKKDYEDNNERYKKLLTDLYEKYRSYSEHILPTENLYLRVRSMVLKELNLEYVKGGRTNESSLLYLRETLEETHVKISEYEHDPLTKKAIEDGKISKDIFDIVIQNLIDTKQIITERIESLSKDYQE